MHAMARPLAWAALILATLGLLGGRPLSFREAAVGALRKLGVLTRLDAAAAAVA
jgi:hypothetical protein